ncbi:hypothetical protein G6045_10910 [Streptomyces sp. YC504]|uniref:Uncharacterized protein n=1 Tax=Streptomyces mesophilus TaxID=1775132 RepID=A0A6G4XG14_9ACTN|nr:hypothetical protein [Streptomyces mesophilus]NGO76173.1 hypothetical protein [Streptomyces mesophilus]
MMADTHVHTSALQELTSLHRQAAILWAEIFSGSGSSRLRERVMRLESLQAAIIFEAPQMLATCQTCGHVPAPLGGAA